MARVKISEYKAKQLVYKQLGFSPDFISLNSNESSKLNNLNLKKKYVVKVDQGVKGRFKKGLVSLDKSPQEVKTIIYSYKKLGFNSFLIEEFISHAKNQEKYISIERVKNGKLVLYSNRGGIDIEKNIEKVKKLIIKDGNGLKDIANYLEVNIEFLEKIINLYDELYFSFLEINPLVIKDKNIYLLDLAVEVDSTAEFFVNGLWEAGDFVSVNVKTKEEEEVINLSAKSQAAFKLEVLNPNGGIFMLLSGGGASIVLADEVYNQGFSKDLANYGEYSGNPNQEETHIYTKNLLSLLLKSKAKKKVLIIGGGVANFTDIRITFKGIIKALEEVKNDLKKQKVKVFVRRGGPYQKAGLKEMGSFLEKEKLFGKVSGPEMVLTDIVLHALNYLKK